MTVIFFQLQCISIVAPKGILHGDNNMQRNALYTDYKMRLFNENKTQWRLTGFCIHGNRQARSRIKIEKKQTFVSTLSHISKLHY